MPTETALPEALTTALAGSPEADADFKNLPPSHRREYANYIEEAKGEDTRQRRAQKTIAVLLEKAGK
jgi:uncharacterized protein YdeI (YjbR/CyaY-like superfamily)